MSVCSLPCRDIKTPSHHHDARRQTKTWIVKAFSSCSLSLTVSLHLILFSFWASLSSPAPPPPSPSLAVPRSCTCFFSLILVLPPPPLSSSYTFTSLTLNSISCNGSVNTNLYPIIIPLSLFFLCLCLFSSSFSHRFSILPHLISLLSTLGLSYLRLLPLINLTSRLRHRNKAPPPVTRLPDPPKEKDLPVHHTWFLSYSIHQIIQHG